MLENVVITGANRGIGLRLAQSYIDDRHRVYAGCRNPETASELAVLAEKSEGRLSVHPLDVTNIKQRDAFSAMLNGTAIDVLINNAGIYPHKGLKFGQLDAESWLHAAHVNTVAPMLMAQSLLSNVAASRRKLIASVSSKMASIAENSSGGAYAYRATKTALNMAMKSLSIDLRDRDISVIVLHPGWVQTDMGGKQAQISANASVAQLRAILDGAGLAESGSFFDRDGSIIPW